MIESVVVQVLDETGGFVLFRDGQRLVFVDRGTRWTVWARFVLGLITAILGINGIVQVALAPSGRGVLGAGLGLVAVAGLTGFAFSRVHQHAKRENAKTRTEYRPRLVVDLEHQVLVDASGQSLAPLTQVSFRKAFQVTSSARALECRWPGGRMTVARGGGMGVAGVDGALAALQQHGVRVSS